MISSIAFTEIEVGIILHRLSLMTSVEELEEIFCDSDIEFDLQTAADFAVRLEAQFGAKNFTVEVEGDYVGEILAECLEGSTYFGDADSAVKDGLQTRQKNSADKRAANTAAKKIAKLVGREVNPALS